jgi:hypothetical protein
MTIKNSYNNCFSNDKHCQFIKGMAAQIIFIGAVTLKIVKEFNDLLACYRKEEEALKKVAATASIEANDAADENTAATRLKMEERRAETDRAYSILVERINALCAVEGDAYVESVSKLNVYIEKYNKKV